MSDAIHDHDAAMISEGDQATIRTMEARIQELEDLVARFQQTTSRLRTRGAGDPPGSGEACCSRHGSVRGALSRILAEDPRMFHGHAEVLGLYDAAVAKVRGGEGVPR